MTRVAFLLVAVGCAVEPLDSASEACSNEPTLTWANWGDGFFANYCRACHSENTRNRYDAPAGVDFDSVDEVRSWSSRIRVRVLDESTMPVGGGVYDADLEKLDIYLSCSL